MMIGVPASGKSTWVEKNKGNALVISTDNLIEMYAAKNSKTYNEVFKDQIKLATKLAIEHAEAAFATGQDVIWDQTNVTRKSRSSKLAMVPDYYEKIAVVFTIPDRQELQRRLANRPGKIIPQNIVMAMASSLEQPGVDEGFDKIITVA